MPKFCKDCVHYEVEDSVRFCVHPEQIETDLVTGGIKKNLCIVYRRPHSDFCGSEGSKFQRKDLNP